MDRCLCILYGWPSHAQPPTRNAHSSVVSALQNLSDLLRRRSCEDLLRRSRVAQRHLWEEVEVFLANPGEGTPRCWLMDVDA